MGLPPGTEKRRALNHVWSIDEAHVYFRDKPLKNTDIATFAVINDVFARDSTHVYCASTALPTIADASTFEALDSGRCIGVGGSTRYLGYGRDATRVYFADQGNLKTITGADPNTFRSVGHGFGCDARHAYFLGWRIKGVKSEGFELLNEYYARTADAVVFGGSRIEGANPRQFKIIDGPRARDGQRHYNFGRIEEKPAFSVGGYEIRFRKGNAGRFGPLKTLGLLVIVFFGLLIMLYEKLTWWRHKDEERPPVPDPEHSIKVRKLAEVLANGDKKALSAVLLAIDDPRAFASEYAGRESFADEPDFAGLIENADGEPSPYWVLHEVYSKRGLLGIIDWRSATDETTSQVDPMLHRLGVKNFDWSFIEVLLEHGDGTELRNNNFLTILRDRLGSHGLTLAHIDQMGDSYGFAVLRQEDFAKIDGLKVENEFGVGGDFGADDSYERGKRILAQHSA